MTILLNRYELLSELGRGSYGTVYSAYDALLDMNVAIKICGPATSLSREVGIYNLLHREQAPVGIPKLYTHVEDPRQEFFVMQLVGPSLRSLCRSRGDTFSPKTVVMLGIQIISRLEYLHERGVLHCDIKEDNFLFSSGIVYIIDFGLCKNYIDPCTHVHVREARDQDNIGTISFCSVHTHRQVRSSRRDDMEALGYLFVRWLKGHLPWEQFSSNDQFSYIYREAGFMKEALSADMLCKGLPVEIREYLHHVKNLRFDGPPNYAYLRGVLNCFFFRAGESNDGIYDWM